MRQSLSRLRDAVVILKGKLSPTEAVPDAGTRASLNELLTPAGSALDSLYRQSRNVANEQARQMLAPELNSLRSSYQNLQRLLTR